MKTVLFIDKGEKDLMSSFLKYDFLLDEFRKEGLFEVCEWRSGGRSVSEAVPDLPGIIGSNDQWQAVVVTDLRQDDAALRDDAHFDNPFDFKDCYWRSPAEPVEESEHALVRLTQMLGGFPEKMRVKWPENIDVERNVKLEGYELRHALSSNMYDLVERYRLGVPRPTRIICITPRDVDEAFFDARRKELLEDRVAAKAAAEAAAKAGEASACAEQPDEADFWQRNDYPAIARFVVCDRMAPAKESPKSEGADDGASGGSWAPAPLPPDAQGAFVARSEWFYFWMCALTLMTSTVEASDLRAFKVYSIKLDIDEQQLTAMFAHRRAQWVAARDVVEARCNGDVDLLRASEYVMTPMPDTNVSIPVTFDLVDTQRLYTDPSEVRFIKDRPEKDRKVWLGQRTRIMDEFRELLRAPRRALRNAAMRFRDTKPVSDEALEYCVLNEYQKDKLGDDLRAQEYDLARSVDKPPFKLESYDDEFAARNKAVEDQIELRPVFKHVVLCFVVAIMGTVVGFVPYIAGTSHEELQFSFEALVMTIACCLLLFGIGMLVLLFMQRDVRERYLEHDEQMNAVSSFLSSEASRLEGKASSYATFRKRWQVMERQWHLDMPTRKAKELGYQSALLKTRIRDLDEIARNCEVAMGSCAVGYDVTWETVSDWLKDDSFYSLCDVRRHSYFEDDSAYGQKSFMDMPYAFMSRAHLEELDLE